MAGFWTPHLIMTQGYCEYTCTLCGSVCPTGAIREMGVKEKINQPVKIGSAYLDRGRCLPWSGNAPCIVCQEAGRTQEDGSPNMLRIIRAKKSGKSFVGCTGWEADNPDACDQTFPMPQPNFYEVTPLEENCSVCHRTPRVSVKTRGRAGRPWKLCFNDDCPTMVEMREKRAERQAAQAAKKAAAEADGGGKAKSRAKGGKKKAGSAKSRSKTVAASKSGPPDPGTRRVKRAGGRGKSAPKG